MGVTARVEQKLLGKLINIVPDFVTPDMMTLLALLAAFGIGVSYYFANEFRGFYLVAIIFYFLHWLGDSLDGKIAREKKKPRPNYGYYIDHIIDSLSIFIVIWGLTISTVIYTTVWLWILVGFLLLMIHTFLKTNVIKRFDLSIGFIGFTEVRLLGMAFSILLFFIGNPLIVGGNYPLSFLDIVGIAVAIPMWIILVTQIISTAKELDKKDREEW